MFLLMSLNACKTFEVTDLKYHSIKLETVNIQEVQELNLWYKKEERRKLLKVSVVSSENIWKFASEHGFAFGVSSYFCERPERKAMIAFPNLYWSNKLYMPNALYEIHKVNGSYNYEFYLHLTSFPNWNLPESERIDKSQKKYDEFNFNKKIEDVCVFLSGGSYLGKFKSNVIKIKGVEIVKALKN